jgi:DNA end-binding protein Ku
MSKCRRTSWKTSTRTIDIDEFVPKSSIDARYLIRPYYLVPDGKVGHDAYAVIRETTRSAKGKAQGIQDKRANSKT